MKIPKDDFGKKGKNQRISREFFQNTKNNMSETKTQQLNNEEKKQGRRSFWISLIVIIILIPATVVISYILGDRRFYVASVIIVILAMIPFFVGFEGRKPDARFLAVLAVMTVIVIVSRVAFMWLPNFKPMAGIIVITAVAFGPQAGFMCGALSMIASNIIFGQGPWTPWQMFCYGMIGFIAGFLAKKHIISQKHAIRSGITTFILVFILSVLILDTQSVLFLFTKVTSASLLTVYIAGIPANVSNGVASALCVFLLIKPVSVMLNRIKTKYNVEYQIT